MANFVEGDFRFAVSMAAIPRHHPALSVPICIEPDIHVPDRPWGTTAAPTKHSGAISFVPPCAGSVRSLICRGTITLTMAVGAWKCGQGEPPPLSHAHARDLYAAGMALGRGRRTCLVAVLVMLAAGELLGLRPRCPASTRIVSPPATPTAGPVQSGQLLIPSRSRRQGAHPQQLAVK